MAGVVDERIRVVLAEMPPMLRDIVRESLQRAPDMVVVGDAGSGVALNRVLHRLEADVVILGTSEPADFTLPRQLLLAVPLACVLMLAVDGRTAILYELQPHQTSLGEVSPQALVEAIRCRAGRMTWQRPI